MSTLFLSFLTHSLYLFSNREVTVTCSVDASGEGNGRVNGERWRRRDAGLSLSPCGRIHFIKAPFGPGTKAISERTRH